MAQLSADCLNEILEYLEDDMVNLHSCLLVNHLWCKISVRIFWRNVLNYKTSNFRTLIACLPNESKEILYNNEIIISTPTSNPPLFNYAAFCKFLSVHQIICKLELLLNNQLLKSYNTSNNTLIVTQEIIKLFFNEISSLKKLFLWKYPKKINLYPIEKVCLKNLSELHCISNFSSEFFYQLSQKCHNLSSLDITVEQVISEGLIDLISTQKNLQSFGMTQVNVLTDLTLLIEKLPITLIKLNIHYDNFISLSFITRFINLQELQLFFYFEEDFVDFDKLQYAIFPKLQILKIQGACPRFELLVKFLENNGKNLKECYIGDLEDYSDNSLNLTIAKFCPNLRKLSTGFKYNELETMKLVFGGCQYLETIKIWCGGKFLNEKEALETVVKYSHENLYEIILYHFYYIQSKLLPEDLESFFINWTNHVPQKSLSLVIVNYDADSLDKNDKNMEIINNYIELGVIKKFKVTDFNDDEFS
ncbi:hypothetical protein C1645_882174 [Glomus cerebriforme]|uniref:F-box domain-containing protein n=1 Tax=Glomus cerebriforme TaxID=658196 RepID=A0A397S8U1_9GLOM|nr:hypothetical protein C1645_882174 [Glomus cerebriforme]